MPADRVLYTGASQAATMAQRMYCYEYEYESRLCVLGCVSRQERLAGGDRQDNPACLRGLMVRMRSGAVMTVAMRYPCLLRPCLVLWRERREWHRCVDHRLARRVCAFLGQQIYPLWPRMYRRSR